MKKLLILLFAVFCGYQGMPQVSRLSINTPKGINTVKGDYYFNHHNYNTAISHYGKAINQNPKDIYATMRIAEAYDKMGNDNLAHVWYTKALGMNPEKETEDIILKYITVLNKYEMYDALTRWVAIYNERISKKYSSGSHAMYMDSAFLLIHNLKSINSPQSDGGAALYNDQLIFSSDLGSNGNFNVYKSLPDKGQYKVHTPLHDPLNAVASKGPIAVAQKAGKLFFTGAGQPKGDKKALMEIFFCDIPANQTAPVEIKKLQLNKFNYDIGHPAVNSEGTLMFFTSNNPKNENGFDLYRSEYDGKKWSTPHSLGGAINTKGDEMYPVLHNDTILYFSSNRTGGLGGFDIYKVNIKALAKHGHGHAHAQAQHLPSPLNSTADDFGLIYNNTGSEAYLTSNRPGGLGGNDLYKLYMLPLKTTQGARGSGKTEELSIYTSQGDEIKLTGNSNERLVFDFQPGLKYTLLVEQDNFRTGPIVTGSNKADLPKANVYTFNIQKSDGVVSEQKGKRAPVQNIHINPGDLITFQLVPSRVADSFSGDSKIKLDNQEQIINNKATIVFSYVAESNPEDFRKDDNKAIVDLNTDSVSVEKLATANDVSSDKILDSKPEPILQQENQVDAASLSAAIMTGSETNIVKPAVVPSTSAQSLALAENITGKTLEENFTISKPDSLETSTVIAHNPEGPSHDAITLENKKPVLPAANDTNGNAVIVTELAVKTVTQNNLEQSDPKLHNVQPTAEPNGNTGSEKNLTEDSSTLSSSNTIVLENKEPVQELAIKSKNADAVAVSGFAMETATENNLEGADPIPGNQTTQQGSLIVNNKNVEPNIITAPASETVTQNSQQISAVPVKHDAMTTELSPSPTPVSEQTSTSTGETNDFQYRVQIAASESELSNEQLKKIYNGKKEVNSFKEDGYYKYYIDETSYFPDARKTLKESGVENAFIAAYKEGVKWKLNEAISAQKKQPAMPTPPDNKNNEDLVLLSNAGTNNVTKDSNPSGVSDTLTGSETIVAVENTPGKKSEKETVSTSQRGNPTPQVLAVQNQELSKKEQSNNENVDRNDVANEGIQETAMKDKPDEIIVLKENSPVNEPSPSLSRDDDSRDDWKNSGFRYRVQIAASASKLKDAQLKRIYKGPKQIRSFKEDGYYKYFIEETPGYYRANQILKESNVDNGFISAYKENVKWVLNDAIALQYKVPAIQRDLAETDSVVKIVTVNFELDEFELPEGETLHLRKHIIDQLKANGSYYTIVNGYTDIRGSEEYNFGLSQERAFFVEQLIITEGIPSERVTTQYFGESQVVKFCPEEQRCDESVHQANRRVEVLLLTRKR